MDHIDPNEAIIITVSERRNGRREREREREKIFIFSHTQGMERFANYTGYGCTLKFESDYVDEAQVETCYKR